MFTQKDQTARILFKFNVQNCRMNQEFCENNSRDIDALITQGTNPFSADIYKKWCHAWELGEDLKTLPQNTHAQHMEEAFEEICGLLKFLCESKKVSYKVSAEWLSFEKAVTLAKTAA